MGIASCSLRNTHTDSTKFCSPLGTGFLDLVARGMLTSNSNIAMVTVNIWLLIATSHRPMGKVNIGLDMMGSNGLKSAKTPVYSLVMLKSYKP
jgi:hypothetical protein